MYMNQTWAIIILMYMVGHYYIYNVHGGPLFITMYMNQMWAIIILMYMVGHYYNVHAGPLL